jgi:PBP1b-binding outer membrane lipoprotein LpoB
MIKSLLIATAVALALAGCGQQTDSKKGAAPAASPAPAAAPAKAPEAPKAEEKKDGPTKDPIKPGK